MHILIRNYAFAPVLTQPHKDEYTKYESNLDRLNYKTHKIQDLKSYIICKSVYINFARFNINQNKFNHQTVGYSKDVYIKFSAAGLHFQPIGEKKMYLLPKETIKKVELQPWTAGNSKDIKLLRVVSKTEFDRIILAAAISTNVNKLTNITSTMSDI